MYLSSIISPSDYEQVLYYHPSTHPQQQKCIFAIVTVLVVCAHFKLLNMAQKDDNRQPKDQ